MKQKPTDLYTGPCRTYSPTALHELDQSDQWIAEEKIDGSWLSIKVAGGRVIEALTRSGAPVDVSFIEPGELGSGMATFVGELVDQHVFIFDIIDRSAPLEVRRASLERLVPGGPHVSLVRRWSSGFAAAYAEIINAGGEGVVLKKRGSPYSSATKTTDWVKVKKVISAEMVCMSSSITKDGRVRAAVGLYDLGVLGCVQSVPVASSCPRPTPGAVVEVEGCGISEEGVVRSGVAVRLRPDRLPRECTIAASCAARPVMPDVPVDAVPVEAATASQEEVTEPEASAPAEPSRGKGNGFYMRTTPDERDAWAAAAAAVGLKTSVWVRQHLNHLAGYRPPR